MLRIVLQFALALVLSAQTVNARPLDQYTLEQWDTADGLPHNTVQSVAQTSDGYLWFGTWEGLVRFNGREMRVFDRASTPVFGDNGIRALAAARDGSLWVGTARSGVLRLHRGEWTRFGMEQGLASGQVAALVEDSDGNLLVATASATLTRIAPGGRIDSIALGPAGSGNVALSLARDGANRIWVGTQDGLFRLDADKASAVAADALPRNAVTALAIDPGGSLLAVVGSGLFRARGEVFEAVATPPEVDLEGIERVLGDAEGRILLGTPGRGLVRLEHDRVERLDTSVGLPNDRVAALFQDREGSIWIGTNGGLARLRVAAFATYTVQKGLSDNYVRSVLETRDGSLWIGTSRGLDRLRAGRIEAHVAQDQLASEAVLSLLEDRDGALWVGTYDAGISILHADGRVQQIGVSDGLPAAQIRSLLQTRDGSVWIGTPRGLARYRAARIEAVDSPAGRAQDYVLSLFESGDGTLWVGTARGVLQVVDGRAREWSGGAGFSAQDVFGFLQDERGVLWIAADDGVYRVEGERVDRVGEAQGLPHVPVFGIIADDEGRFWISSNRGVFRIGRAALDAAMQSPAKTASFSIFREAEGLASSQFSGASTPSMWRRHDGSLWFATAKGVAVVDPRTLDSAIPTAPPLVIEEVLVDGRPVDPDAAVHLPAGARKLEIRFAGLSFIAPGQLSYRTMLEGLDLGWDLPSRNRTVVYSGLPPGEYRFHARVDNGRGEWGTEGAEVGLAVEPHFWQTRWFPIALAALLLFSGFLLVRVRIAQLRARASELEREVDQRTLELREQTARLEASDRDKSELLERLRLQSEAFARQAREDALTGLPNRRTLDQELSRLHRESCESGRPLAVAVADIDHFKQVNDRYSHPVGDEVIRAVAIALRDAVRSEDVVGRFGGEEFLLLFPGLAAAEAAAICERARAAVTGFDFALRYPELTVSISVGVADRGDRPGHERVLLAADARLYEAKRGGRNQVVWDGPASSIE